MSAVGPVRYHQNMFYLLTGAQVDLTTIHIPFMMAFIDTRDVQVANIVISVANS